MTDAHDNTEGRELLDKWEEIRTLIETMDIDVRKNAIKGNASAGLRSRRGLRLLKKYAHDLLMTSVTEDKRRGEQRKVDKDV